MDDFVQMGIIALLGGFILMFVYLNCSKVSSKVSKKREEDAPTLRFVKKGASERIRRRMGHKIA